MTDSTITQTADISFMPGGQAYQSNYADLDALYARIPLSDLAWALSQGASVHQLLAEAWLADPFGSRRMVLNTGLARSTFRKAKKVLSDRGLFLFKRETSMIDSRETVCWLVQNLHGSRVYKPVVEQSIGATTGAIGATTGAPILPQPQSHQAFQEPSVSSQDLNQDLLQSKSARNAQNMEEEEPIFEELEKDLQPEKEIQQPITRSDRQSGKARKHESLSANRSEIQLAVHQWLVDEHIDTLQLSKPVGDKIAYAWSMIDGEWATWEKEYLAIASQRKQEKLYLETEIKLAAAIQAWADAGHPWISICRVPGVGPVAIMDGIQICASDFLVLPVVPFQRKTITLEPAAKSAIAVIKDQLDCRNKLAELKRWFTINSDSPISDVEVQLVERAWCHASLRSVVTDLLDRYLPGVFDIMGDRIAEAF